ncbi:MAG: tetratricopeptide repeat protein [Polaromonas sp.]
MSSTSRALPTSLQELAAIGPADWKAILNGDVLEARQWVQAAARLGHPEAQVVLGQWLLDGKGGPRNPELALQWFLKAAAQQHPMGLNMAGRCYENGWSGAVDVGRAVPLYKQAADLGLDAGMYNYANQLASGKAIAQNHKQALGWYSAAAELGHAKSMTKAGRYFEDGVVVGKDLKMALECYRQGAEGGDFRGQFSYAGMLAGLGRKEEALQWLRKVPATATAAYLEEAGRMLLELPHEDYRSMGRDMQAAADARKTS